MRRGGKRMREEGTGAEKRGRVEKDRRGERREGEGRGGSSGRSDRSASN